MKYSPLSRAIVRGYMREKERKHRQKFSKKNMDIAVRNYYWELEEKEREKERKENYDTKTNNSDIWIHVLVWSIAGIIAFKINPVLFWFIAIVSIIFSFKSKPSPYKSSGLATSPKFKDDNPSATENEKYQPIGTTLKVPCVKCNVLILPETAKKTGGKCMPCTKMARLFELSTSHGRTKEEAETILRAVKFAENGSTQSIDN